MPGVGGPRSAREEMSAFISRKPKPASVCNATGMLLQRHCASARSSSPLLQWGGGEEGGRRGKEGEGGGEGECSAAPVKDGGGHF